MTRLKVQEAEFFLLRMKESYYDDVRRLLGEPGPTPAFHFYLSAFLSASRSISWVMKSEYGTIPGWKEWYEAQRYEEHTELLSAFNHLRIQTVKRGTVLPGRSVRLDNDGGPPVERDPRLPHFHMSIAAVDTSDGEPIMSGDVVEYKWTVNELNGDDLLEACRLYLSVLSSLVTDCETSYPFTAA